MFGRIHQWGHRVLGCNAFEYWFSVFTKVSFFTSVSTAADLLLTSPRVSSTSHVTNTYFIPLGLLSLPNSMVNPCHRVLYLPSKSSKVQQLAMLASVREEMGKRWEEVTFLLLNCSKEEILHGICPETCRTAPVELSMNSPLGLIVKKCPVLQLGTLHFPHTVWLRFASSSSSLAMISPSRFKLLPLFLVSISREPGAYWLIEELGQLDSATS